MADDLKLLSNNDLWYKLKDATEDFVESPTNKNQLEMDRLEDEVVRRFREAFDSRGKNDIRDHNIK